jgi:NADH-quinone oxidoreductase subunit A
MNSILLTPPFVLTVFLILSWALSRVTVLTAAKGQDLPGKTKAYACGEDVQNHRSQPEYGQFFPFAFFFTIMHVVVLIIATVPTGMSALAGLYLAISALALFIFFRR